MHGDYSWWGEVGGRNLAGVLHQQGRVLLDRDWNDQARLTAEWQDHAARETIGPGVLAVSSRHADAFRVTEARVDGSRVLVTLLAGRAWADGLSVSLPGDEGEAVKLEAAYFGADVQAVPGALPIPDGTRDAVVLEVWRETLSAFQAPDELLEPALGGPDTTGRLLTSMRLRLFRMDAGEDCHTIALGDQARGTLTVTLRPTQTVGVDCPVVDEGGYEGLEHHLYRIEVAEGDAGKPASFKWSRFNGGLVGSGTSTLNGPERRVALRGGAQAIRASGTSSFYLEVVKRDEERGHWRVVYGARATLNGEGELEVNDTDEHFVPGDVPSGDVFFRLWDGIRPLADFPVEASADDRVELRDGIFLQFAATGVYRPGDYWTFPVRAGEIDNPETPLKEALPHGVVYHRVPLAELDWSAGAASLKDETVEDCRRIFRPLVDDDCCCTFTVGDGVRTHGDFDSIEEAIRHLPPSGGKVCVLPGVHRATARIVGRKNVEVSGCGIRSVVLPGLEEPGDAIFFVSSSKNVHLHDLTLVTHTGTAVFLLDPQGEPSRGFRVERCRIVAAQYGVLVRAREEVAGDNEIVVSDNRIALHDTDRGLAAVFVSADGARIERNRLVVIPAPDDEDGGSGGQPPPSPTDDPCADAADSYDDAGGMLLYVYLVFLWVAQAEPGPASYRALGGIQVGGGSERVRIAGNEVVGGAGHAITLGRLASGERLFFVDRVTEPAMASELRDWTDTLYDVEIEGNALLGMRMCGVGVAAFVAGETSGMIRVQGLSIHRNRIERCLRVPVPIPPAMRETAGLGGIALADTGDLSIRGNLVRDNGRETREAVCGVFVLMADGAEVADNTILRNGPGLGDGVEMKGGHRAGVLIAMARETEADAPAGVAGFQDMQSGVEVPFLPALRGVPAARVHHNVVAQPVGQALALGAVGAVSVQGNALTSQGVDFKAAPLSLLAGTVLIYNLGIAKDLLTLGLYFSGYDGLGPQAFEPGETAPAQLSLDALRLFGWPSGRVQFTDNQVTLDLRANAVGVAISSIAIVSLDDVAFADNQAECASLLDIVLADTMLFGFTARASANRFQDGVTLMLASLISVALLNTAMENQSTRCLVVEGWRKVQAGNLVLFPPSGSLGESFCTAETARLEGDAGTRGVYGAILQGSNG